MQSSIGKQADLVYLNALMAQRKQKPSIEVLALLQETIEVHFSTVKVRAGCTLSKLQQQYLMVLGSDLTMCVGNSTWSEVLSAAQSTLFAASSKSNDGVCTY